MINASLKNTIKEYSFRFPLEEACGLVVSDRDSLSFVPCKNRHSQPAYAFSISPRNVLDYDVKYIFHSHPKSSAHPSRVDMSYCDELRIPFLIYSILDDEFILHRPK